MVRFQIPTRATLKIEGFTLKAHIMYNKKKTHLLVLTYSGDLNTLLVGYLNGQREVGCQMVQFFNAIWIQASRTIWILDKWTPSCFLMYCSGIQMVGLWHSTLTNHLNAELFEIQTLKSLVFKCCQYSDSHCAALEGGNKKLFIDGWVYWSWTRNWTFFCRTLIGRQTRVLLPVQRINAFTFADWARTSLSSRSTVTLTR